MPIRLKSDKSRHSHYRYDMTRLGLDMLAEYRHREEERAKQEVLQKDYVR